MKQTTIKDLIKSELVRTCYEVTRKLREKDEKKEKKRKFSREEQTEMENKLKTIGWTGSTAQNILELFAILLDAPELKAGAMIPRELFSVVVLEDKNSGHGYALNSPYIVTDPKKNYLLCVSGGVTSWAFGQSDKPRFATDSEIESCIESLSEQQWKTIKTHDIFKPIMEPVMNLSVSVESTESNTANGDAEEIQLADGRTISA